MFLVIGMVIEAIEKWIYPSFMVFVFLTNIMPFRCHLWFLLMCGSNAVYGQNSPKVYYISDLSAKSKTKSKRIQSDGRIRYPTNLVKFKGDPFKSGTVVEVV